MSDAFYLGLALGIALGGGVMWWLKRASLKQQFYDEYQTDRERKERAPYLPFSLGELERWSEISPTLRTELTRLHEQAERELEQEKRRTPEERQALIRQLQKEASEYHAKALEVARKREGA